MTGPVDDRRPTEPSSDSAIEAVLLDIDGTLLDSNDAHAQAWSDALREANLDIGSETVRPLIGMGSDKLLAKLTGIAADSEEGKRLVERSKAIFAKEYLPLVKPFPQARELLERMRDDGATLVVATSASDDELRGLLSALGAEWLVDETTSSSDANRSKPDPDIVRVAVDKAGVGPAQCVMVGDTPYDVEAATRSRVRIIGVRCGGHGDEELRGAVEIYDDPAALLSRYDESVIGRGIRSAHEPQEARPDRAKRQAGPESEPRR
ncbi:MAG TPA: HAD family hydrolase [Gemmatimonadaceae bacterium]|nr:HAD family hydrolase [Gemmatimonadaceae bacterium]